MPASVFCKYSTSQRYLYSGYKPPRRYLSSARGPVQDGRAGEQHTIHSELRLSRWRDLCPRLRTNGLGMCHRSNWEPPGVQVDLNPILLPTSYPRKMAASPRLKSAGAFRKFSSRVESPWRWSLTRTSGKERRGEASPVPAPVFCPQR
ncbi:hypothetical protein GN956_G16845 [Arapaima gigas]